MFGYKVSKYNIVDATPFHRDPMKELAAACQRAGNTWDFPDESKKNFAKYFEEKVKPKAVLINNISIQQCSGLSWRHG